MLCRKQILSRIARRVAAVTALSDCGAITQAELDGPAKSAGGDKRVTCEVKAAKQ
eukprot:gene51887-13860_t